MNYLLQVGINKIVFVSKTTSLYSSASGIQTSKVEFSNIGSKMVVIDKYNEIYENIRIMMDKYRELVMNDTRTVMNVGTEFDAMDNKIATMLNSTIQ